MAWKAKEPILWFNKGDVVEDIQENWKGHFEEVKSEANQVSSEVKSELDEPKKKKSKKKKSRG